MTRWKELLSGVAGEGAHNRKSGEIFVASDPLLERKTVGVEAAAQVPRDVSQLGVNVVSEPINQCLMVFMGPCPLRDSSSRLFPWGLRGQGREL